MLNILLPILAVSGGYLLWTKKKEADQKKLFQPFAKLGPPQPPSPTGPTPKQLREAVAKSPALKTPSKEFQQKAGKAVAAKVADKLKSSGATVAKGAAKALEKRGTDYMAGLMADPGKSLGGLTSNVKLAGEPSGQTGKRPRVPADLAAKLAPRPSVKLPPMVIESAKVSGQEKADPVILITPNPGPIGIPPPMAKLDRAAELARKVQKDLTSNGEKYDKALLAEFQRYAELGADGRYGGQTAGALMYFTGESPVKPYANPRAVIAYRPRGL